MTRGSCTNGKKAWPGMVVIVGGYNNGRHSCVVGKAMAGPWVGIRPLLPGSNIATKPTYTCRIHGHMGGGHGRYTEAGV